MLIVYINEMSRDGEPRQVGSIYLNAQGRLEAQPVDDTVMQDILARPIRGNKYNPLPVSAKDNPVKFLQNLQYHYRSPYLNASAPRET